MSKIKRDFGISGVDVVKSTVINKKGANYIVNLTSVIDNKFDNLYDAVKVVYDYFKSEVNEETEVFDFVEDIKEYAYFNSKRTVEELEKLHNLTLEEMQEIAEN